MTKNQEEALRRELTELGSVMRTFANKNDGVEQSIRAMEHRRESTDRAIKNLDQKYEGMMNMMAQIMAKLNDKGKEVEGGSSGSETRIAVTTDTAERVGSKGGARLPKMDFPAFDGNSPREWVRRANKYFQIHGVEEGLKSDISQLHFQEKADIWFHGMYHEKGVVPWKELAMAVCERFGEGDPEEAIEEFNKLMQTGSVTEYLEKFEQLKSMVMLSLPGQPDSYYKSCFLSGLKEEIVSMVRMTRPHTLADTIEAAKLQERNLEAIRKTQGKMMHKYTPSPGIPPINKQNFTPHTKMKWPNFQYKKPETFSNQNTKTGTHTANQFRKITPSELSYRREKGLCFKCAEPYTLGHICKQAHLNYMLIDDPWGAGENSDEPGKETEEFCDCPEGELSNQNIEVSIHALAGGTEHKTLKLKGKIAGMEIIILVDSGSTHCFIDERLAETIQLPAIGNPLTVRVANGEQLESRQLQGAVQWEMQGNKFTHQFNTLKLGSCHMVLGVDWLARYSPIKFDFRQLSMRFLQGRQPVELKGEVSKLKLKAIKGSKLTKWRKKQAYGISAQLCVLEEGKEDTEVIPAEMKSLLDKFEGVFAEPQGMPPRRSHDHSIPLKQGATPFQVRPYKCPYVQKSEIERLVKEMLQMGIIQPSNSHFASPVLLVKKKDGSWRFCVDYRQLNELTMKDKFPMPLIDELLDELHGSKYFTKIDLRAGYHQIRVKVEIYTRQLLGLTKAFMNSRLCPLG
ncbi:uncharacterized protein LOC113751950 [Coffea eugenioides]|uniref:uncharacterized protein LOC113751950 n=1 Tax=Coffea eugenioides TaxID=49369 RepID=UPI000F6128A0|nr:uncharacterized protein LOC113751950 [Coffea eugenioides]